MNPRWRFTDGDVRWWLVKRGHMTKRRARRVLAIAKERQTPTEILARRLRFGGRKGRRAALKLKAIPKHARQVAHASILLMKLIPVHEYVTWRVDPLTPTEALVFGETRLVLR